MKHLIRVKVPLGKLLPKETEKDGIPVKGDGFWYTMEMPNLY